MFNKKKRDTTICIAGTNENNCSIIAKLKELQSQADVFEKDKKNIESEYIASIGCGNYFHMILLYISLLSNDNHNVLDDVTKCVKLDIKRDKILEEISSLKKEIGIK